MIGETCLDLYETATRDVRERADPPSRRWLFRIVIETAERSEELSKYDLPGAAIAWNFASMMCLVRWTWRTLEPPAPPPSDEAVAFAPWNKPPSELSQMELKDSLQALAVRWNALAPTRALWEWLDALDRRAADLCVRTDLGDALNEGVSEEDGVRFASDAFFLDVAAIFGDMWHARVVHRDFLKRVGRVSRPPADLPVVAARAWLVRERSRLTAETREALDERLAKFSVRPGELPSYARAHLGVLPNDARVVLRHARPLLSDHRKERPLEPYLIFDLICQRHAFDWMPSAFLLDRFYFRESEFGIQSRDVMFNLFEPVVLRIMGSDYVCHHNRAWRCSGPTEAICLWIRLVSSKYKMENQRWDMGFLKIEYDRWLNGEQESQTKPIFV
jgi:hypothetical protein